MRNNDYPRSEYSRFEKVSYEQFKKDSIAALGKGVLSEEEIKAAYDDIKLPARSTFGSAGYDFYSPYDFIIDYGQALTLPTGIRSYMPNEVVLCIYPRSGQGFKTGISLANTIGVIDSDYYNSDNEGHIMAKLTNNNSAIQKSLTVDAGTAFCQGIFFNFVRTYNDKVNTIRNGGFGSTDHE